MIKELNIKNFAIIDSLNVKFNEGFNVITGETGAGKTLIIKAIDILLGGKINKKMIRNENIPLEINGKFIQHGEVLEVSRIFRNDEINFPWVPLITLFDDLIDVGGNYTS